MAAAQVIAKGCIIIPDHPSCRGPGNGSSPGLGQRRQLLATATRSLLSATLVAIKYLKLQLDFKLQLIWKYLCPVFKADAQLCCRHSSWRTGAASASGD
jgi:hypothetical protein